MAAPVIRGQTAPVAGGSTTSPAGTQVGDLVLVYTFERLGAAAASTLSVNAGAGFQQVRNHFHDDGSTDGALGVAYKVATQAGAQSYQGFTSSTGTPVWWTGCTVLQVGTFDAAAIIANSVTQTNNAVPNPPSVAGLTSTRDYLVLAIAAWHLGSAAANTATAPTNYTNLVQLAGSATGDLAAASRAITGATSEDPGTFGDDQAPNGTCSITLAVPNPLPPAEGSGTTAVSLGTSAEGRTVRYSTAAAAALVLSLAGVGDAPEISAPEGSGTAALTLSVSGDGRTVRTGSGSTTLTLGTSAAGVSVRQGSGTIAASLGTSGTGATAHRGTGTTALTLSTSGSGARQVSGSGTVAASLGVQGTGKRVTYGSGPSAVSLAVSGAGEAPDGEAAEGSGTATLTLSTAGAGSSYRNGSSSVGVLLGTVGDGQTNRSGGGSVALALSARGSGPDTTEEPISPRVSGVTMTVSSATKVRVFER